MRKSDLIVAAGYLGAVIGAGFASGQELVQFFVAFGISGFKGIILAGGLFAVMGGVLFLWVSVNKLDTYQEVLYSLFGRSWGTIVDAILAIFLFLGVCTMLSASGAVFHEHINQSKMTGIFTAYFGLLVLLMAGSEGLIKAYNLLVPLKYLLLLTVTGGAALAGGAVFDGRSAAAYATSTQNWDWLWASLLYVAYNFTLAMVVLPEYRRHTGSGEGICGAVIGGFLLGLAAMLGFYAMYPFLPDIIHYQIPMLYVAGTVAPLARTAYMVVLWLGILTTALANTFGFAQRVHHLSGMPYGLCLFMTVSLAVPLATQSFSFLVATVYPLLGLLGLLIMGCLTVKSSEILFICGKSMIRRISFRKFEGV